MVPCSVYDVLIKACSRQETHIGPGLPHGQPHHRLQEVSVKDPRGPNAATDQDDQVNTHVAENVHGHQGCVDAQQGAHGGLVSAVFSRRPVLQPDADPDLTGLRQRKAKRA